MLIDHIFSTILLGLVILIMIRGFIDRWFGGDGATSSTDTDTVVPTTTLSSSPPTFRTSISSYFLPPTTFSHTPLTLSQTRIILTRKLPAEIVTLVLDAGGEDLLVSSSVTRSDLVVFDDSERGRFGRSASTYWKGSELEGKEWLYVASGRMPGSVVKVMKPEMESEQEAADEEEEEEAVLVQEPQINTGPSQGVESPPDLPSEQSPWRIKKIIVKTTSSDQGWTSMPIPIDADPYDHSYTWFELAVAHPDGSIEPSYVHVQKNLRAVRIPRRHVVDIELWEELVQRLRHGDRLCLRARASFIGWQNRVHNASITFLYGF